MSNTSLNITSQKAYDIYLNIHLRWTYKKFVSNAYEIYVDKKIFLKCWSYSYLTLVKSSFEMNMRSLEILRVKLRGRVNGYLNTLKYFKLKNTTINFKSLTREQIIRCPILQLLLFQCSSKNFFEFIILFRKICKC